MIAVVEQFAASEANREALDTARFYAETFRRAGSSRFGEGAWVRRGLGAIVRVMPSLPGAGTAAAEPWLTSAAGAAEAVHEDRAIVLQRGLVQDAFRATADALIVLSAEP